MNLRYLEDEWKVLKYEVLKDNVLRIYRIKDGGIEFAYILL